MYHSCFSSTTISW